MRTLILLGGEPPSQALLAAQLDWAERVLAADSGVDPLIGMGLEPDVLCGDLDSIQTELARLSCKVLRDTSDYATDFEKALRQTDPLDELHVLGATGRRHDHFLTNLLITAGLDPRREVLLFSDHEVFRRITPERPLGGSFQTGATASLIPFAICQEVVTRGLKWDLDSVTMGVGAQLGQSNIVRGPALSISIGSGVLFFVLQADSLSV
jgi:thiamine pyrophosphokinase